MRKYVIERDIPGAGNMSPEELNGASAKSCKVLDGLGNESGFRANRISEVKAMIDPTRASS